MIQIIRHSVLNNQKLIQITFCFEKNKMETINCENLKDYSMTQCERCGKEFNMHQGSSKYWCQNCYMTQCEGCGDVFNKDDMHQGSSKDWCDDYDYYCENCYMNKKYIKCYFPENIQISKVKMNYNSKAAFKSVNTREKTFKSLTLF